jgi:hypothetical protein
MKETLEEAAEKYVYINYPNYIQPLEKAAAIEDFIAGAKWQAERMYSYDELRQIAYNAYCLGQLEEPTENKYNLWIQQFKKK